MTPRDLRNIHTTGNSCRGAHSCADMAQKLSWYFTCWWRSILVVASKFGLLTMRQHSATIKHLLPYPQGDRSDLRKQKKISINTNHSYHQRSSDLTIKPNSVLTNSIKYGVQIWSMWNIYLQNVFLLWHHHYKCGQARLTRHLLSKR